MDGVLVHTAFISIGVFRAVSSHTCQSLPCWRDVRAARPPRLTDNPDFVLTNLSECKDTTAASSRPNATKQCGREGCPRPVSHQSSTSGLLETQVLHLCRVHNYATRRRRHERCEREGSELQKGSDKIATDSKTCCRDALKQTTATTRPTNRPHPTNQSRRPARKKLATVAPAQPMQRPTGK